MIKCEETLHILRFLNRIWNEAASSQLRRITCVDLTRKSFVEIQDFWNILQYNKLLKLPCPFRRYKLAIQVVQDELIADILEQKDVQLVCLCYTTDQNITQDWHLFKNLYEILMQHQTSLQHFKLTYSNVQKSSEDEGWYNHELKLPDLKLTALREFDFFSWSFGLLQEDEPFRRFLCSIFKAAPNLRRFCTNCDDSNLINGLLSKGLFRKITSLYLKKLTPSSFSSISNAQISLRKITSLGLIFLGVSQHIDLSTLIVILRQVKRKLEELAVTKVSLVNGHGFPAMTNLRRLLLHDSCGSLGELNETRFPNLQCLYLSDFNQNSDKNHNEDGGSDDFVSNPHFGVQELAMKFSFHDRGEGRSCKSLKEKQLTLLLAMLPLQFPNLSSFYLYMPKVSLEIIRSVIRLFPSLEALKLESLGPEFYLPEDLFTQHDNQCECPDFDQACNFLSLKSKHLANCLIFQWQYGKLFLKHFRAEIANIFGSKRRRVIVSEVSHKSSVTRGSDEAT